jgi:cell division protein FtsQ
MQHAADLPLDIRLMTAVTRGLVVVFVLMCVAAAGTWIARHPAWTLRGISVQGDLSHQNAVSLRAQLASPMRKLQGSFLTMDLQQVRSMFETVPWVRQALVQREFPNRLRVTLEEHVAVAWWGQSGSGQLVSRLGEVFEANPDEGDGLPELVGPIEQAAQVWALYQSLSEEFGRLERSLVRLELNERGSWRAELDNGARIELGRGSPEDLMERTRRFTASVGQLAQRYPGALQSVDLRYPNGYALRVQGVTTLSEDDPKNPAKNR